MNLTPEGPLSFALPRDYLRFRTRIEPAPWTIPGRLATVIIEPDHPRVILVWRSSLTVRSDGDYLDKTVVSKNRASDDYPDLHRGAAPGHPWACRPPPAAARCGPGSSALGQHPFLVDRVGDLMPGALDPELDARIMAPERLLALAGSAVREACEPLADARASRLRLPVYLGLPEPRPGFREQDAEAVRSGLTRVGGATGKSVAGDRLRRGHAAGLRPWRRQLLGSEGAFDAAWSAV